MKYTANGVPEVENFGSAAHNGLMSCGSKTSRLNTENNIDGGHLERAMVLTTIPSRKTLPLVVALKCIEYEIVSCPRRLHGIV